MKRLIPLAFILPLASCGGTIVQQNTTGCAASLMMSGQREVSGLLHVAASSPSCQALAADALQAAVREAMLKIGR